MQSCPPPSLPFLSSRAGILPASLSVALTSAFLSAALPASGAVTPALSSEQIAFFENKIRPIFANHCLECHSVEKGKVKGGLSMDSRQDIEKGGDNGAILKPGDVAASSMIKAVEWKDDLQMPPKKQLSAEQIDALKAWITMGAPDPRESTGGPRLGKKDHWAFQPVSRPKPPTVKNAAWCKNSIDKFVLAKLEEKGMLPADPPDTGTLDEKRLKKEAVLRRAYFDLIGIPPTPKEITDFVSNESPNAFEKVIDALLASPAYGERWARHWMDTARYSDTTGLTGNNRGQDYRYAHAWSYRDWLIRAINEDMPYNQFVLNQLAADKIDNNPKENLAALGFLTVGQRFQNRDDIINDRIDVVGRGFLGLTLACARCHDHKFDPVKQADYYALHGVFRSTVEPKEGPVIGGDPTSKEGMEYSKKMDALKNKAFQAAFDIQTDMSERFRKHAGVYLQIAYLERSKEDVESVKKAAAVIEKNKLSERDERFVRDHLRRRLNARDPILGPFVQLIGSTLTADGLTKKGGTINPLVSDFLSKAGDLPHDLETVSALFEKFCRTVIDPAIKGGIFKRIAQQTTPLEASAEKSLMELAAFPNRLVTGAELQSIDAVKKLIREWGLREGGELENRAGLAKINEVEMMSKGAPVRAMVLEDLGKPVDSPIYPRGNAPKTGEEAKIVPRRFIEVLSTGGAPQPFKEGSGRLELAKAIASPENPLTARVMVNRIWMYHFGEGLVRTPDDLGNQAGKPTHPELLDFLSSWFVDDYGASKPAWSLKALHKAIMLSNAYQQSSRSHFLKRQQEMDPANSLLWHANVRRLDFEAFRDSLLTMSGTMDRTLYGPPINLVSEPYSYRRTVYGYIDRGSVPDLLAQFDVASALEPNTKRTTSIVPQQALFLMNSPFTIGVIQKVVQRPEIIDALVNRKDTRAGILNIFQIVLGRSPSKSEFDMAYSFLVKEARMQNDVVKGTEKLSADGLKQALLDLKKNEIRGGRGDAKKAIMNEGELVARHALSPWESLVQALMFCNEAAYLN
ncbi:MAG: hypothetical protein RLZZ244_3193 [Verrucomicrobiota bacterium]|jgi:hypothetical protein